jgi:PAS domain S-box-containing protein
MATIAPTLNHLNGALAHAAVGVAVSDLQGRFLEVNEAFCLITGYTSDELRQIDPLSITHPDHRHRNRELVSRLVNGEIPAFVIQMGYVKKDGSFVWVQNSVSLIRDLNHKPFRLLSLCENTTEHKVVQHALQESRERFRVQFKATPVPIFSWRRIENDFVLIDYNDAADRMTEHGIARLLGQHASQLYVNTPEVIEGMERCFTEKSLFRKTGDFRLLSSGELKRLDVSFVFVPPDLVMIHTEDITERVNAEEARFDAEQKYRDMFESSNVGMFQSTPDGRYLAANPALARMLGFDSPEELIKERTSVGEQEYVDSSRREEFKREIERHGIVRSFEYEAYRKDGSRIWISASVRAVRDRKSLILSYEGIAEDVTERKRSEDAIRKQKELLETIFDHIPVMIIFMDRQGNVLFVNQEWEQTLGWTLGEVQRDQVDIIAECYPDADDRARVWKWISEGSDSWGDFRTRVRDGHVIDTLWANVKISDGTSIGIGKDISREKRAQRFRDAAAALSHGLSGVTAPREAANIITHLADKLIGWDACSLQMYDSETDTVQTILAIDSIDGKREDVTAAKRRPPSILSRAVIDAGPKLTIRDQPLSFEKTAVPIGDTSRPSASIMTVPIRYGTNVLGVLSIQSYECVAYDQTSLKDLASLADLCGEALNRIRAEQSLYESEERFRQIAENIEDVIWVMDTKQQKLLYVSPSYENIWARPIDSLYSHSGSYEAAVHPEDRQRVATLMADRIEKTGLSSFEYRILRPDGSIHWIRSRSFPIRDSEGQAYRLAGIAEDITERKGAETALRDFSRRLLAAQESERMNIARELHDEIGQVLTAVRINLQRLERSSETRETRHHVGEGLRVIDEALNRVRDLSFELRPSLLDDLGLAAATRWYVNRYAQRAGVKAKVQIDFDSFQLRPSREVETACFRILQEALTNVARHANAKNITVVLRTLDAQLFLSVKDDGVGMEKSIVGNKPTLGLRGMEERALAVYGKLEILSTLSQGTEVRVSFPISQPEFLSGCAHG